MTYASAGHPPPLMRSAGGAIVELAGSGLPLGLRALQTRPAEISRTMRLDAASLIVLYTDGLIEATRDIAAGEAAVRAALSSDAVWNAPNPAAAISSLVLEEVVDDVAILSIRLDCATVSVTRPAGLGERDARWAFAVRDQDAAAAVRHDIVAALRERGAIEADTALTELVFSELLGNVVRHCSDEVDFALDVSGDAPILHALDRGPGFTYNALLPNDIMSVSGRGLFIVRSLIRELTITRRIDGGSHARAVLPFRIRSQQSGRRRTQARFATTTTATIVASARPAMSSAASAVALSVSINPVSSTMRGPASTQRSGSALPTSP
jgi:anti-sigma regulatory factor (Ser/Thr protein kinase)